MRFFLFGRRQLVIAAICAVLAVMTVIAVTGGAVRAASVASAGKKLLPIYAVGRNEDDKVVSLSFDAAWGNEDTQMLIDIFKKYDIKVTFFVVGEWVDKFPQSVKALSDAGHEVMNHSDDHPHMASLSKEQMAAEITACNKKIETVTGVSPILFRAPYGEYCDDLITTLDELGMYCIQWDVDSLDWKDLTAPEIQKRVLSKVKSGSIVLFHNAALHTPEALPAIIEKLLADGYKIVPISENIYREGYTLDHEGRQQLTQNTSQQ